MSSVTLTKALQTLKRRGLIETGYRQVVVADTGRIEEMLDGWDA
jgi:Mn-dependent DtxR family transcriptional regulator